MLYLGAGGLLNRDREHMPGEGYFVQASRAGAASSRFTARPADRKTMPGASAVLLMRVLTERPSLNHEDL